MIKLERAFEPKRLAGAAVMPPALNLNSPEATERRRKLAENMGKAGAAAGQAAHGVLGFLKKRFTKQPRVVSVREGEKSFEGIDEQGRAYGVKTVRRW